MNEVPREYFAVLSGTTSGLDYVRARPFGPGLDGQVVGDFVGAWSGSDAALRWLSQAAASDRNLPSIYQPDRGDVFFLSGDSFIKGALEKHTIITDLPHPIALGWPGLEEAGFSTDLDAATSWDRNTVYFFKDARCVAYDLRSKKVIAGYPKTIISRWSSLKGVGFGSHLDAVLREGDWFFIFKGDRFVRYHLPSGDVAGPAQEVPWKMLALAGTQRIRALWSAPLGFGAFPGSPPPQQGGIPTGSFRVVNRATKMGASGEPGNSR